MYAARCRLVAPPAVVVRLGSAPGAKRLSQASYVLKSAHPHSSRRTRVQQHLHGCEVPRPGSIVERRVPTAACMPHQAYGVQASLKHTLLCTWMSRVRTAGAVAVDTVWPLHQQPRQLLCVASLRHGAGAFGKLHLLQAL